MPPCRVPIHSLHTKVCCNVGEKGSRTFPTIDFIAPLHRWFYLDHIEHHFPPYPQDLLQRILEAKPSIRVCPCGVNDGVGTTARPAPVVPPPSSPFLPRQFVSS